MAFTIKDSYGYDEPLHTSRFRRISLHYGKKSGVTDRLQSPSSLYEAHLSGISE